MSDYTFISFGRERGTTVKSYKTASRAKSTLVTIEIECTDSYALGDLLSQLHEAKHPRPQPKPEKPAKKDVKALPAPLLQISDMRSDIA
jgi:hypothetical protein